jgi:hypothetical protein
MNELMRGWPSSLVEIAEVIGTGATLNLVDAFLGLDYCYVPHDIPADHRIAEAIGPAAAKKLSERYAGEKLFLPVLASARHRKRLIAAAEGKTSEVAQRFGVSARWVREVRQDTRPDTRQIDMFQHKEPAAD